MQFRKPFDVDGEELSEITSLPVDVTLMSDSELMVLFGEYIQWTNYVDTKLALASEAVLSDQTAADVATARAISASGAKQVTQAKSLAMEDPVVIDATYQLQSSLATKKALTVQKDALERLSNFLSRELSRRIGREPTQRRFDRLGSG